ncbi:hypothetical protein MIND_01117700 [Mycena indigotica]|uniref:Uncharacterized protein n=1 Tax=Mycena indigotica TaxID=2126181 RepID=A0A8H6S6R4_9AGAR|nr:uncharacterized protein MIND_01117700 [Mycena indigotica]KAF7293407.1 hypothetical protein MIND_01117700 [Mycena indigotica]
MWPRRGGHTLCPHIGYFYLNVHGAASGGQEHHRPQLLLPFNPSTQMQSFVKYLPFSTTRPNAELDFEDHIHPSDPRWAQVHRHVFPRDDPPFSPRPGKASSMSNGHRDGRAALLRRGPAYHHESHHPSAPTEAGRHRVPRIRQPTT